MMLSNRVIVSVGLLSSQTATGSLSFAISLYLLDITKSVSLFSLAVALSFVPSVVISLLSGVWVDRWAKKRVICLSDLFTGLFTIGFVLTVDWSTTLNALLFYIVIIAAIQSLLNLSFNAALPELFAEQELPAANGLIQSVTAVTRIVAPITGALLYGYVDLFTIFCLSGATYFASSAIQTQLQIKKQVNKTPADEISYLSAQKEVFSYIKEHRSIRFFLLYEVLLNSIYLPFILVMMPFVTYQVWGVSPFQLSLIEASIAIGTILGAVIASRTWMQKRLIRYFCLLLIPQSMILMVWGYPFGEENNTINITAVFSGLLLILAILNTIQNIPVLSQFQRTVPQHMLGRLFGIFFAFLNLAVPAGVWILGSMLSRENWQQFIMFGSVFMIGISLLGNKNKSFRSFVNENLSNTTVKVTV
ncbi:hypothetical protein A1OQ_09360 [Enterovibrio norvegicus FF-162]|uniref:MFS transporter n=1 Tax=Enterovibrio norvegicus TaxID=188144 RepID=UPI0002EFF29C|nr:MFS transporter [Enterovibrio norvegicus]OEE74347.1 hypothetical protein A1OQ_09360 [Enterovibrio norvegicus FF-162]